MKSISVAVVRRTCQATSQDVGNKFRLGTFGLVVNTEGLVANCTVVKSGSKYDTFYMQFKSKWGTRWRSWLTHCATSQKATGSIPDGVIKILHRHNPSGRTAASTRDISWG